MTSPPPHLDQRVHVGHGPPVPGGCRGAVPMGQLDALCTALLPPEPQPRGGGAQHKADQQAHGDGAAWAQAAHHLAGQQAAGEATRGLRRGTGKAGGAQAAAAAAAERWLGQQWDWQRNLRQRSPPAPPPSLLSGARSLERDGPNGLVAVAAAKQASNCSELRVMSTLCSRMAARCFGLLPSAAHTPGSCFTLPCWSTIERNCELNDRLVSIFCRTSEQHGH